MPRIRNIRPEFFLHEELSALPYQTRLLFIGLWTQADRSGRLEDRPKRLKVQLFPYDKIDLEPELARLHASGFIVRYEHEGERFIAVPKLAKHQHFHKDEKTSTLPAPCEHPVSTVLAPSSNGASRPIIGDLKSEIGNLKSEIGHTLPALRPVSDDFTEFWLAYPRKAGKGKAQEVWRRLRPPLHVVLDALSWQRLDPEWLKEGGRFVPHPSTYLNARRWEDEPSTVPAINEVNAHNLTMGAKWLRRTQ